MVAMPGELGPRPLSSASNKPGGVGPPGGAQPLITQSLSMPALLGQRTGASHGLERRRRLYSAISTGSNPHDPSSASSVGTPSRKQRPGSGRFYTEELVCFKRVPTPSPHFNATEWGFQVGEDFCMGSKTSDASRPSSAASDEEGETVSRKGSEKRFPVNLLPLEVPTARVLERIYPQDVSTSFSTTTGGQLSPSRLQKKPLLKRATTVQTADDTAALSPRPPSGAGGQHAPGTPRAQGSAPDPSSGSNFVGTTTSMGSLVPPGASAIGKLQKFRHRILDKFATVKNAFEAFAGESEEGMARELSRKQFSRFLNNHFPGMFTTEHSEVFDFLDADKNGSISIAEMHTAIQAAAPVKTVADLRRKWIALGFMSMRSAVMAAGWAPDNKPEALAINVTKRYTLQEFGAGLQRTGIDDPMEHLAVFTAVEEHGDRNGTVSLDQLVAALAAVSPPLLLEELREKLIRKFGGLGEAYDTLNPEGPTGSLTRKSFNHFVENYLGFSVTDAHKVFASVDIDCNGKLSRRELIGALRLVEPNLFLEDVRKKVRQRYASIAAAVKALKDKSTMKEEETQPDYVPDGLELPANRRDSVVTEKEPETPRPKKPRTAEEDLVDVLKRVQFDKGDIKLLLKLLDPDGENPISTMELTKGMAIFAPSSLVDELRLFWISKYGGVNAALDKLSPEVRDKLIEDWKALDKLFKELKVPSHIPTRPIFDLVEHRRMGGLLLNELASALLNVATGSAMPLSSEQLDARARQQIHWQLAPFRRHANELRGALRVPVGSGGDVNVTKLHPHARGTGDEMADEERIREPIFYQPAQESFRELKKYTQQILGPKGLDKCKGYYSTASVRMCEHQPLFTTSQHRAGHHQHGNRHRACLLKSAPLLTAAFESTGR